MPQGAVSVELEKLPIWHSGVDGGLPLWQRSPAMTIPVQETIEKLTPTAVAREMGLPISTVFRWMKADRIPGTGAAHEWRRDQFEAAVKRLGSTKVRPRRQAKAA